jgi:hypothetical protein
MPPTTRRANTSERAPASETSAHGEVAILLANPTPIPVHYVVKGLEGRRLMVYDVNKGTDRVRSRNVTGSALDIGGEAVQLIVASQQ